MQDVLPGTHGDAVAGTHGAGVKNTGGGLFVAGFAGLLHMAKGMILAMGMLSMIVAAGIVAITLLAGSTIMGTGAVPKEHINCAPAHTLKPICPSPRRNTPPR